MSQFTRAQWESLKYADLPGSALSHGKPVADDLGGVELCSSALFPAAGEEVAGTWADIWSAKLMCLAEGSLRKHKVILPLLSTNLRFPCYV